MLQCAGPLNYWTTGSQTNLEKTNSLSESMRSRIKLGLFNFLFGTSYSSRAKRDQRGLGTTFKNLISPINNYGTCFSCNGSGAKTLDCSLCDGTGTHHGACNRCNGTGTFKFPARSCPTCTGTGLFGIYRCRRCAGVGLQPPSSAVCNKCHGSGAYSAMCKKCEGAGEFKVSCRKCGGSGWHRF